MFATGLIAGAFKEEVKVLASTVDNDPRAFYVFLDEVNKKAESLRQSATVIEATAHYAREEALKAQPIECSTQYKHESHEYNNDHDNDLPIKMIR